MRGYGSRPDPRCLQQKQILYNLLLSTLLCPVNNGGLKTATWLLCFSTVCHFAHDHPIMISILLVIILGECNALWGERELPRFMFVCMFYMLLIYVQHFSYQDYTKG